jgi:hypothetical protein
VAFPPVVSRSTAAVDAAAHLALLPRSICRFDRAVRLSHKPWAPTVSHRGAPSTRAAALHVMSAAGGTTLYDASRGGGVLAQNGNLAGVPDLEALLSCSESCFKVLDLDGRILYVSPSASRVLRVDPARLLGCVNAA